MKQVTVEVIDHGNGYIEIRRVDDKKKVMTVERYRLIRTLKSIGVILGAVLAAVLFCGAAVVSDHPAKALQAVILFALSAAMVIGAVVWSVTGGEKK